MIEIEEARGLLARAVLTKGPNFVYFTTEAEEFFSSCQYAPNINVPENDPRRTTGCLIGVALDLAGWTKHQEDDFNTLNIFCLAKKPEFEGKLSQEVVQYFLSAQRVQDDGGTWGNAYNQAEMKIISQTKDNNE